jgi:putative transposase
MCRALEASRSGYYSWRQGKESQRSEKNRAVLVEIKKVHEENREAYGAVKTWRELNGQGVECGRHRVARLRRHAGIEARRKRPNLDALIQFVLYGSYEIVDGSGLGR